MGEKIENGDDEQEDTGPSWMSLLHPAHDLAEIQEASIHNKVVQKD